MSTISVESMPKTVDEFIALRDNQATTAEGGVVTFIVAIKMYQENPEIGEQCLVIAVDRSELTQGNIYKGFAINGMVMSRLKEQVRRYPYIANSYFKGANADNGYEVTFPSQIEISTNSYSGNKDEGVFKVFAKSNGADSPRPITIVKNNKGLWKAKEWSSILMGIVPPKEVIDDDL